MGDKIIRIGGACAGWGDGSLAVPQLVQGGQVDYLIFDFLAEFFMPVYGRMRAQNPALGYSLDFADTLIAPSLADIARRGIKLVTNAGAVNPAACAAAFERMAGRAGIRLRVATVSGDDLIDHADELRTAGYREMFTGDSWPDKPLTSANVYFGGAPIAAALAKGADVVITGRVVDSALVLGPLLHEFGWALDDYDRLAAGSVIGHLLECGAQVTGGLFTDWRDVPDWANIGYPIAECRADGSAIITKAPGTGGLVSVGTVAEQLLYEIGDPARYFLPDVTADLTQVRLAQDGPDRVLVSGARGHPPTAFYKTCITWDDGFRGVVSFPIRGPEAKAKAERVASEVLTRVDRMLRDCNLGPFTRTAVEILGAEATYGARARHQDSREVICRMAVEHDSKEAIGILMREQGTGSISMAPGHVGMTLGVNVNEVARVFSFLVPKTMAMPKVTIDGASETVRVPVDGRFRTEAMAPEPLPPGADSGVATSTVPLLSLAWVRNGDKGDISNIAVIARKAEYLPYIAAALKPEAVRAWYAHLLDPEGGRVERYYLPGIAALNFLLHGGLDGGCTSSLRFDPLGKSVAQELLDFPVPVSADVARAVAAL
ncbi:MAG TPA: acyclic terpene utilization AtuA family protein [Alphaproteobacteria bacterium]|nr:acyclic terpene utilization AtuA family protein [Alphaproteobacteria bacterium]